MSDAQKRHPEEGTDEVFLTNTTLANYRKIGYRTKRTGDVAYDVEGGVIRGMFPVFVSRSEYAEARR